MKLHNSDDLLQQIRTVRLTKREVEVLTLIREGITSQQVANRLFISKKTVDFHLGEVYGKLNVANRIQALQRANQMGLIA